MVERIVAFEGVGLVSVAAHQSFKFGMRNARQHRGIGDFVAVEMEDGEHRAIGGGIEEFVGVPAGGERAGLRFAVADDAGDDEIGIVECRAIGVHKRVAELAAFVDGAGSFRRDVAGDSVGPAELAEEALDAVAILLDVGVDLGVGAFKIGVRHDAGTAVSGTDDVDHVEVAFSDEAIPVDVEEVEAGGGAPVAEQARLDVVEGERTLKERIVFEVDLADGEVVGGAEVGVDFLELIGREGALGGGVFAGSGSRWRFAVMGAPRGEVL